MNTQPRVTINIGNVSHLVTYGTKPDVLSTKNQFALAGRLLYSATREGTLLVVQSAKPLAQNFAARCKAAYRGFTNP